MRLFRERLEELRKEGGYKSNVDFAKAAGITRQAMTFYLNGKRKPDFPMLVKLCTAFHCSADWLLGLSDVRTPNPNIAIASLTLGLSEEICNRIIDRRFFGELHDALSSLLSRDELVFILNNYQNCLKCISMIKEYDDEEIPSPNTVNTATDGSVILSTVESAQFYAEKCGHQLTGLLESEISDAWVASGHDIYDLD